MKEPLSLRQAIIITVQYFDILDWPLTISELESYVYGWSAPKEAIEEVVKAMPEVSRLHVFYFLKGREETAELRKERSHLSPKLWKKVDRFAWLLALCPFVKMVAICNSLALGNAKPESDIDLFVITADNRLSTARFFMKLFTQIFGVRVHHEFVAGRFCLSFFVTEKALNLESLAYPFDPHLAYFVLCMKPLFGEPTYKEFLKQNQEWTGRYFKKKLPVNSVLLREHSFIRVFQWIFEIILSLFGRWSENFFMQRLKKREEPYIRKFKHISGDTSRVIKSSVFKFHENDPRKDIAEKFLAR